MAPESHNNVPGGVGGAVATLLRINKYTNVQLAAAGAGRGRTRMAEDC
jgi:hypothetical protein